MTLKSEDWLTLRVIELQAEIDALQACNYESIAMYRRCRDERDALRAELNEANERRAETIAMCEHLRADAARYRLLAARMVHVEHPAGSGWTLDEVLVSENRDLDETVDALAKEQICAVAKNGQIPGAKTPDTDADPCPRKMAAQWRDASTQALADLSEMRLRVLRQDAVMRQALEALINARDTTYSDTLYPQFKVAINALNKALEGKR